MTTAAAAMLLKAERSSQPIERLPAECRPGSAAAAYAIQDIVAAVRGPIGGWKVGLSSPAAEPGCAPIFAVDVLESGAELAAADLHQPALEIEFAFRLERDLPAAAAPFDRATVAAAIRFVPLIEILSSRYLSRGAVTEWEALADRNANGRVVVGAPVADWAGIDWRALRVDLDIDGVRVQSALDGHPSGDPLGLVVWQANHCVSRGLPLRAGMVVTTGSLQGATPLGAAKAVRGTWGPFGTVEVTFG